MSKDISGASDHMRWIDAVRRRDPELSIPEAAAKGEILDRWTKKAYADGYELIAVKPNQRGELDIRAIEWQKRDDGDL